MSKSKICYKVLCRIKATDELVSYNHEWVTDSEDHLVPAYGECSLRYFKNQLINSRDLKNRFLFVFDTFENALDLVRKTTPISQESTEIWKVQVNSPHFKTHNGLKASEVQYKGTVFCKSLRLIKKVY